MGSDDRRAEIAHWHDGARKGNSPSERISDALARGDTAGAVVGALSTYGAEVFGFLSAVVVPPQAARRVYATFVAEFGRALPGFRSSFHVRVFAYFVARHALRWHRAHPANFDESNFSTPQERRYLRRSSWRSRAALVALVRRALAPEDRELLVLCVDRGLTWHELALTSLGEHGTEHALKIEAAELQHRFLLLRSRVARLIPRPAH